MREPHRSFINAAIKINWSLHLLSHLRAEINFFIDKRPFDISLNPSSDGNGFLLSVNQREQVPNIILCLAGDICHNLRSSGDYCWMGVQRSLFGSQAEKKTLPIQSNVKGLTKIAFDPRMKNISTKIKTLLIDRIGSHSDFKNSGNIFLSELNELSNLQKHNMLTPVLAVTKLGENTKIRSNDGSTIVLSGSHVNGRVAGIGGTQAEMTYDTDPVVDLLIWLKYHGKDAPILWVMENFINLMKSVLNHFCDTWPSEENPYL